MTRFNALLAGSAVAATTALSAIAVSAAPASKTPTIADNSQAVAGTIALPVSATRTIADNSHAVAGTIALPVSAVRTIADNSQAVVGTTALPVSATRTVADNAHAVAGTIALPVSATRTVADKSRTVATPAVQKAHGKGKRHSWHRGACGSRAEARFERRVNVIEGLMEFTPPQQTAWTELKTAMKSGQDTIKKSCEARKEEGKPKTAIERFDRVEDAMATRLSVMRSVKPAFAKFYGTLSEKQQKAVDEVFTRKGRRG